MSSSNDRHDRYTSEDDVAVSRLYREAATETTPPELSERVLKQARSAVRPRYALPAGWMRPLAWTATVGLCFAIALNLTTVPEGSVEWGGDTLQEAEVPAEPRPQTAMRSKLEKPEPATDLAAESTQQAESRESLTRAAADGDFTPANMATTHKEAADGARLDSADVAERGVALERQAPPRAAGRAEFGAIAASDDAPAIAAGEARAYALVDEAATLSEQVMEICGTEGIETPDAWLKCIEALEAEGLNEEADAQRRRFLLKYPNYDVD